VRRGILKKKKKEGGGRNEPGTRGRSPVPSRWSEHHFCPSPPSLSAVKPFTREKKKEGKKRERGLEDTSLSVSIRSLLHLHRQHEIYSNWGGGKKREKREGEKRERET